MPISVILIIFKIWLLDENNALEINDTQFFLEINKVFKNKFTDYAISLIHINDIIYNSRLIIAHYIKNKYILEEISEIGKNEFFSVDESNFINVNNKNLWAIGANNTSSKIIRLDVTFVRYSNILKKFIYNLINPGNFIVSDSCG